MSKEKLEPWKSGDFIEASRLNDMQRIIERNDASSPSDGGVRSESFSADRKRQGPQIKFVRMREPIGPDQTIDNHWYNREGRVQVWNPSISDFEDTQEDVYNVVDPEGGHIADTNQIVPCVSHNGKLVAISWTSVRHAVTCRDRQNNYPAQTLSSVRVFPIKFISIEYTETLEPQTIGFTYLYPGGEFNDDYVCNLRDDLYAFIPEGTVIWCYRVQGQWFTFVEGDLGEGTTEHSHSSLSDQPSEESTSTSDLSQSSTSQYSTSSSSTTSTSSSSTTVSESSSNYDCVDVVTCLEFDEQTCVLTYEVKRICFPKSLGIRIEDGEATGCS